MDGDHNHCTRIEHMAFVWTLPQALGEYFKKNLIDLLTTLQNTLETCLIEECFHGSRRHIAMKVD
jgi:hypothetical protein